MTSGAGLPFWDTSAPSPLSSVPVQKTSLKEAMKIEFKSVKTARVTVIAL